MLSKERLRSVLFFVSLSLFLADLDLGKSNLLYH